MFAVNDYYHLSTRYSPVLVSALRASTPNLLRLWRAHALRENSSLARSARVSLDTQEQGYAFDVAYALREKRRRRMRCEKSDLVRLLFSRHL